jgi:serine phosphatase RsbU (regulator of sigma subunit)
MLRKVLLLLAICFSLSSLFSITHAQSSIEARSKFKSLFIHNFTKYTEWPAGAIKDEFVIGVLNDNQLYESLTLAAQTKKIKDYPVVVKFFTNLSEASECQIFCADAESGYSAGELFGAIGEAPVMLITEGYPYNTTMFNFLIVGTAIKFQLNTANVTGQGLIISESIGKLATDISDKKTDAEQPAANEMVSSEADWQKLLEEANKSLEAEKFKSTQLEKNNLELSTEVEKLSTDLVVLRKQKQKLESSIKEQGAELEEIYGRIGLQKDVYKQLTKELDEKNSEIESKEQSLLLAEKRLNDQLAQLEETTRQNMAMEKKMNLTARLLDNQKTLNFIIIAIALIIAILGGIAYRNYRVQIKQSAIITQQKREVESQRDEIHEQHEQLEEKSREITDSIQYAKRIQTAILPPTKLVREYLNQSFVLYKPKDIVAGDFYWMETVGDVVYFAAADCTGHGVPGAMVSVICVNGLNRSVREFGLRTPAEILDKTRELVIKEFEKSEEEVKDGMDISLCALNTKTNELQWAGANNPLWIVTSAPLSDRSTTDTKLTDANQTDAERSRSGSGADALLYEVKANKQPIGKYGLETPFTNHSIQLEKGDTIYIFSDGYPDQFGGDRGKKYKSGNFKKTLVRISTETIEKQKQMLDQEFESWRGSLEQIDDVCVIGVRV